MHSDAPLYFYMINVYFVKWHGRWYDAEPDCAWTVLACAWSWALNRGPKGETCDSADAMHKRGSFLERYLPPVGTPTVGAAMKALVRP